VTGPPLGARPYPVLVSIRPPDASPQAPAERRTPWVSALLLALLIGGVAGLVVWGLGGTGGQRGLAGTGQGLGAGPSRIVVDSPELRAAKAAAGIEDCAPGPADPADAPVPQGLPSVVLPCLAGGPDVDVASLRGPMVVNLWAQWCPPCERELPLYADFHDRHGDRVPVLGIDWSDPRPDRALEMLVEAGATYPQLADPDVDLGAPLRVRTVPLLVMIDAEGRVVYNRAVEITSVAQLEGLVAEHLGVDL